MWTLDVFGSFVLIAALATVLLLSLVARAQRSKRDLPIWLVSTLGGGLLGASLYNGYFLLQGYEVMSPQEIRILAEQGGSKMSSPIPMPTPPGAADAAPGAGSPGPGSPGGIGGSPGGMGGGPGGPGGMGGRGPSPKRQLSTLVRKLELLTGDIAIRLEPAQAETLGKTLAALQAKASMTDDEAKDVYEAVLATLDERQKTQQDSISLPFRRGGGGPGAGGPGGGGPGAGGPMGGQPPAPDANPFAEEEAAKALASLIERLGTPSGDVKPDAPEKSDAPVKPEESSKPETPTKPGETSGA